MVSDIVISKKNESFLFIDCEMGILQELSEHFSFEIEGAKFHPKVKAKVWDGVIKLLDLRFGTLPAGLYQELLDYSSKLGYTTDTHTNRYGAPGQLEQISIDEIQTFVDSLNIHSNGNKVEVRDYQIKAIFNCISNQRQIAISPTGSGKSLILYAIYRWYEAKGLTFMLVVPNLSLIKQMFADFSDYSSHNGFDVKQTTQIIAEGANKTITKKLILSTWQSIYKQPAKFFNDNVDVLCGDECFSADTKISTPFGWKSIAHVCKGDLINNIDNNGNLKQDIVVETFRNLKTSSDMLELTFDNGIIVNVTGNHKFMLSDGSWKRADHLTRGDDIKWVETGHIHK